MQTSDPRNDLLQTVVHQLKTPINAARGCIELVQNLGPLNERQAHFAERAIASLDRMTELVARLLDLAWIDAGMQLDLAAVDLGAVIENVVESLEEMTAQRQIVVELDLDKSLGLVHADIERMRQVLDNLIGNAVKYNRDGGTMWVSASGDRKKVQVSVRDSGIGIPAEDLDRVFERFYRSRLGVENGIEGTGLGLAIVEAIVREHQGRIWVESEEGAGTTFSFALPRRMQFSEGSDLLAEAPFGAGEGGHGRTHEDGERSSEASDSVDDNLQESREESSDDDSRGDDV